MIKNILIAIEPTAMLRWSKTGKTIVATVGQFRNGSNQLKFPWSLSIDSLYKPYVDDRQKNRVQKYLFPATLRLNIEKLRQEKKNIFQWKLLI
jgi:hypothetical protein